MSTSLKKSQIILVTGGAGFIGSACAEHFLLRRDTVIVLDEMNDYYDPERKQANIDRLVRVAKEMHSDFVFVKGSFCDEELVQHIFSQYAITTVCHLGARAGVRPSIHNPYLYLQANITGTTILLEASVKHSIQNFVYASSSSVYGESSNSIFRESDRITSPCSQYAATKAMCEMLAATYHHIYNLNVTGLRFFTVYGPNGRPDMAPYKFIDRIFRGEEIEQYGDGHSERDYTFIDDIVSGVVAACDVPHKCAIFNLGNGNPIMLSEFIATIENLLQKKAVIRVLPPQPGDVSRTCADITLAKEQLGYHPSTPIREGLRRTVLWYLRSVAKLPEDSDVILSLTQPTQSNIPFHTAPSPVTEFSNVRHQQTRHESTTATAANIPPLSTGKCVMRRQRSASVPIPLPSSVTLLGCDVPTATNAVTINSFNHVPVPTYKFADNLSSQFLNFLLRIRRSFKSSGSSSTSIYVFVRQMFSLWATAMVIVFSILLNPLSFFGRSNNVFAISNTDKEATGRVGTNSEETDKNSTAFTVISERTASWGEGVVWN